MGPNSAMQSSRLERYHSLHEQKSIYAVPGLSFRKGIRSVAKGLISFEQQPPLVVRSQLTLFYLFTEPASQHTLHSLVSATAVHSFLGHHIRPLR